MATRQLTEDEYFWNALSPNTDEKADELYKFLMPINDSSDLFIAIIRNPKYREFCPYKVLDILMPFFILIKSDVDGYPHKLTYEIACTLGLPSYEEYMELPPYSE